jgi:hypothetical protein
MADALPSNRTARGFKGTKAEAAAEKAAREAERAARIAARATAAAKAAESAARAAQKAAERIANIQRECMELFDKGKDPFYALGLRSYKKVKRQGKKEKLQKELKPCELILIADFPLYQWILILQPPK